MTPAPHPGFGAFEVASARLLPAGTYACRPAHILHGPFFTQEGCLLIEFNDCPPSF